VIYTFKKEKAMKKIYNVVAGLLLQIPLLAWAQGVTYFSMTNPDTPHLSITAGWIKDIEQNMPIDWKKGLGCGGKRNVVNHDGPMLVEIPSGRMWSSLHDGNEDCLFDWRPKTIVSLFSYPFDMCVKADSAIQTFQDFAAATSVKIGYPTATTNAYWVNAYNAHNRTQHRGVMFRSSGLALLGLLSGDIDVAIMANLVSQNQKNAQNIRCFATTAPNTATSLSKLTPYIPQQINEFQQTFALFASNITESNLASIQDSVHRSVVALKDKLPASVTFAVVGKNISPDEAKAFYQTNVEDLAVATRKLQ
jgi:hypothetical protein